MISPIEEDSTVVPFLINSEHLKLLFLSWYDSLDEEYRRKISECLIKAQNGLELKHFEETGMMLEDVNDEKEEDEGVTLRDRIREALLVRVSVDFAAYGPSMFFSGEELKNFVDKMGPRYYYLLEDSASESDEEHKE